MGSNNRKKIVWLGLCCMCISPVWGQLITHVKLLNCPVGIAVANVENTTGKLLSSFNAGYIGKDDPSFKGIDMEGDVEDAIDLMWEGHPFYCAEAKLSLPLILRADGNFEVRNIPIYQRGEGDTLVQQWAVMVFNRNGAVVDFLFGLDELQTQSVLSSGNSVTDFRRRQIILDFIENFRTAYNRKDTVYLKKVLSDNALIIVGKVINEGNNKDDFLKNNLGENRVQLISTTKEKYLAGLRSVFEKNRFLKVGFQSIEIKQHRMLQYIYGVSLHQTWKSSIYSDEGYVFLLIDFKNDDKPIIHVRAWQPKAFTGYGEKIDLGDFEL